MNPAHHAPLYDLYSALLRQVKDNATEEFDAILLEESVAQRLDAIDALCAERGVTDLDVAANASRVVYHDGASPEEVARNTRAEAKRREAEALREEAARLETEAQEMIAMLETKRETIRNAANGLLVGTQAMDSLQQASLAWASRPAQTQQTFTSRAQ